MLQAHALAPVYAAASSQHGFHVKAAILPIQEASLAEEHGGSATIPAVLAPQRQWQPWRSVHAEQQQARVRGMLGEPPVVQQQQQQEGRSLHAVARMQVEQLGTSRSGSSSSSSSEGHNVEVLTAHSSSGVRRLVKSVVRGLRACQVHCASVIRSVCC